MMLRLFIRLWFLFCVNGSAWLKQHEEDINKLKEENQKRKQEMQDKATDDLRDLYVERERLIENNEKLAAYGFSFLC